MTTLEWAGRKREIIYAPALSILGVSVPTTFFEGLRGIDLGNGFLNRHLILFSDAEVLEQEPPLPANIVPPDMVIKLKEIFRPGDTL